MIRKFGKKAVSLVLAGSLTIGSAGVSMSAMPVYAGNAKKSQKAEKKAQYVSDVFIAYGKTEKEAVKWLKDNDWEPLNGAGDFNAGKNSSNGKSVAAVMGIKRTDDPKKAVTDMAVMNMCGGYSFPQYEEILDEKRAEIDDFIYSFIPTIEEFRANFNGEGSEMGQKRAELACELMNKFYDGGAEEKYCKNDTGLPLGDLFLEDTVQEGAGEGSGDLEQIILEGSGPAVAAVENALALAADTAEDSWMERLQYLTMEELTENVDSYVPAAEGQDVAPSAAMSFLMQEFGDAADTLAGQWEDVHEKLRWYEEFRDKNDLNLHEDESAEEYEARYEEALEELRVREQDNPGDLEKYLEISIMETGLETVSYPGEWGETLGDFFNPAGDSAYTYETESFLPLAAALSEGQRCGLKFLPLELLLKVGVSNGEGDEELFADTEELLDGCECISVYSGVNRGIFRGGVALTSKALMEDARGEVSALACETNGVYKALYISAIVTGGVLIVAGGLMASLGILSEIELRELLGFNRYEHVSNMKHIWGGVALAGVGAALLITGIMVKVNETHDSYDNYYNKEFTKIPAMIVDADDIITYEEEDGEQKQCIEFDQYAYYEAVRCNRQDVGELGEWQKGVSDYERQGCGDIADLNADQGREWLALYTAKAFEKGKAPILADDLKLAYGENNKPDVSTTPSVHFFCNSGRVDLADRAYCYSNDKGPIYLSWKNEA